MPESLERCTGALGIAGDNCCIKRTDGYPGYNIGINVSLPESFDDAAFKRAECAATLQDKYVLRRYMLETELWIAQLVLYRVQIDPIADQRFNRFGFLRRSAQ